MDLKALAKMGAEKRLADLRAEEREIYAAFPELRGIGGRNGATRERAPRAPRATKRRKRKPMTAAQRKAVGIRMKKYWAARRKASAKG